MKTIILILTIVFIFLLNVLLGWLSAFFYNVIGNRPIDVLLGSVCVIFILIDYWIALYLLGK